MSDISGLYRLFLAHPEVSTDSRKVVPGCLFFALSGPKFDGNAFALPALEAGAAYAVVSDPKLAESDERCIYVEDTLQALQDLAHHHRMTYSIPVIAITGTNGKTTTKELMRNILAQKYEVLATEGNLNNHIGVPLTLLRLRDKHEVAIVEMGASGLGEIALLASIAEPTMGVVTNVGKAHLQGFGSLEGVLNAKSELPHYLLAHEGDYFLNLDDPLLKGKWGEKATWGYGIEIESHELTAKQIESSHLLQGEIVKSDPYLTLQVEWRGQKATLESQLTGRYNYQNILSGTAVGLHLGVTLPQIANAVKSYKPSNGRSQVVSFPSKEWTVVVDAYNANPSSMQAALQNLDALTAPHKAVVLGDMLELGEETEHEHRIILEWLSSRNQPIQVVLCGEAFGHVNSYGYPHYATSEELAQNLTSDSFPPQTTLLLKGSRGVALEKVLARLEHLATN